MSNELLLVYEPSQVPQVALHRTGKTVVALDWEVELELQKLGIPFGSFASLAQTPKDDRALVEHTWKLALDWYTDPKVAFLEHDGIKLGEQYEVGVLYYIQTVYYWAAMLTRVLATHPQATYLSIFDTFSKVSPTADPTARFKERAAVDVLRLLAQKRGIPFEIIPAPARVAAGGRLQAWRTWAGQRLARVASATWNVLINFTSRSRPIRLFATDPWYRIKPFIKNMEDVELIMSRRGEMRATVPLAAWRTRARFHHRLDFADRRARALAHERAYAIRAAWGALGSAPSIAEGFVYGDMSLWPVMRPVFDCIINEHAEEDIATIESVKAMFKHYRVNCVLLFATTKGYNLLLARIAERMNIPSIELQHALSTVERGLVHSRLNSRYLAAYGAFTRWVYESWGIEPLRIIDVGSPRFDHYAQPVPAQAQDALRIKLGIDGSALNVLAMVPMVYFAWGNGNFTGYEAEEVLEDYAAVERAVGGIRYVLRPRPGGDEGYFVGKEMLKKFRDARFGHNEDLRALLSLSDIVVAGNSTVVLESMLMHKPVILYPQVFDRDFEAFERAGAILVARGRAQLEARVRSLMEPLAREALVHKGDAFVRDNFMFDGRSAERVAELIRSVK